MKPMCKQQDAEGWTQENQAFHYLLTTGPTCFTGWLILGATWQPRHWPAQSFMAN